MKMKYIKTFENHTKDNINILYHGSKHCYSVLYTSASEIINNEMVVFATNKRWLALCFITKFKDSDIKIGYVNDVPFIEELKEGAFEIFKTSGYIHTVSANGFKIDKRLGMKSVEFITTSNVKVLNYEKIDNVYNALKETEVNMIPYDLVLMIQDQNEIE